MNIYLSVSDNKIMDVDIDEGLYCNIKVSADNIDSAYRQLNKYGEHDDSIEEKLIEFFKEEPKVSITSYDIKHWVSNRSFGELIDMYVNGEIKKPDMQREFVWDSQKSSRLIESIIIGLPIPPLFLMEVNKNDYEIIDGFQRLTAVTNFVMGYPWNKSANKNQKAAKLSGNISEELKGKTFNDLEPEYKRIIKRSTIPLIEFSQTDPDDKSSKYLIFERINTGSEKLNQMQIRKALAYGAFMRSLYDISDECGDMKALFTINNLRKDAHVEAILRIKAMSDIYYGKYEIKRPGITNILNDYCEYNREIQIERDFPDKLRYAIQYMMDVFDVNKKMFRRVEKDSNDNYVYKGILNVSILEAMLGVAINNNSIIETESYFDVRTRYNEIMYKLFNDDNKGEENPFSQSTGTLNAINRRFKVCEEILGITHGNI